MEWSPQQDAALVAIRHWLADPKGAQVFRLFGYAGTGKTTMAKQLAEDSGRVAHFLSYTGKAVSILKKKGCPNAQTIHRVAYRAREVEVPQKDGSVLFNPEFEEKDAEDVLGDHLLILDECSMVDADMAMHLLSIGCRVLVMGDPAQLPPVKPKDGKSTNGYFIDSPRFPIGAPDVMLTEVHRQAQESPILRLATLARNRRPLPIARVGDCEIRRVADFLATDIDMFEMVIAGRNDTRHAFNRRERERAGYPDMPRAGEPMVCLMNNYGSGIMNGEIVTVLDFLDGELADERYRMRVRKEGGDERTVTCWTLPLLGRERELERLRIGERRAAHEFAFGYAITCHKAQGSEYDSVVVCDEAGIFARDGYDHNWRYTAITRAANRLLFLVQ